MKRIVFALLALAAASSAGAIDLTSTACPGSGCQNYITENTGTVGVQITNTFVGTAQFEQTVDGVTWVAWTVSPSGGGADVTSTTTTGVWFGTSAGTRQVRVRVSAYTSGTLTVSTFAATVAYRPKSPTFGGTVTATNFKTTGVFCGTNDLTQSCDPAGWGARLHLSLRDNSDTAGAPVFEIVNAAADADLTPIGTFEWVYPANTSGNEMAQLYTYTHGGTAANRGAQFRFLTKKDGANTMQEALRLDASGASATPTAIIFNPNNQAAVLDVGNSGSVNLISAKGASGNSAYLWLSSGATTNRTGIQIASNATTKWFINSANAVDTPNDKLQIVNAGFATEVMTILQGGTVGINNANPSATYKLDVAGAENVTTTRYTNGVVTWSATAPTVSSGFGASPSIAASNGTAAFEINVGTGGAASSGVIGLPTATTGWRVTCDDVTTKSATVYLTKQTASSTASATVGNFDAAGAAQPWAASDHLICGATAY